MKHLFLNEVKRVLYTYENVYKAFLNVLSLFLLIFHPKNAPESLIYNKYHLYVLFAIIT